MIVPTGDPTTFGCAVGDGVGTLNMTTGAVYVRANPEAGRVGICWNDGKVDPAGRLWVGTYNVDETAPRGSLWMFADWDTPVLVESGIPVWNGPAFSPDGCTMYASDSIGRRILAYSVHMSAPYLTDARIFAEFCSEEGLPDGLTVDTEGCVWCAHWDGARVTRFSPGGERLAVIHCPAPRITSVAFGTVAHDILFITSARYGMSYDDLASCPAAGDVFSVRPGVRGSEPTPLSFQ